MLIAGFRKTSFIDYPGQPCAVVFTPYCNMDCSYCHNAEILRGSVPLVPEEEVMAYLAKRAGLLRALTISGGEPTLQQNLLPFIVAARELGYRIKLDTNGTKPQVLKELMQNGAAGLCGDGRQGLAGEVRCCHAREKRHGCNPKEHRPAS